MKFHRVFARCVLVLAVSACALFAARAQSPEVARGLSWLAAQVQPDGSLQGVDQSIATKQQNRAEVTQTLKLLVAAPSSLATALAADGENNTEFLSRKIISLAGSTAPISDYIASLIQRQNKDGGFGGAPDYASNSLDTSWAVLALAEAKMADAANATQARAYLLSQLDADGAMRGRSDAERVQGSALALLALQSSADAISANAVRTLTSWLLRQQGADGGWQGDTYLSALALAGVSPVTADATVRTAGRNFLLARQMADGSWNGDPFLTALVLRAIASQDMLPASGGADVRGRVIDNLSGQPLAGVTVTLSGPESRTIATDMLGAFAVKGLSAGSYRITLARTGYNGAIGSANVSAGQTLDAGTAIQMLGQGPLGRRAIAGAIGTFYSVTGSGFWGTPLININFRKEASSFIAGHTNCIP